jgi:hypothetical protein
MRMKADVGPDRVSPLSNSRSCSSKSCATHSGQEEDDRLRDLKILCASFFALPVPRRRLVRAGLRESFNESMRESYA